MARLRLFVRLYIPSREDPNIIVCVDETFDRPRPSGEIGLGKSARPLEIEIATTILRVSTIIIDLSL